MASLALVETNGGFSIATTGRVLASLGLATAGLAVGEAGLHLLHDINSENVEALFQNPRRQIA